MLNLLEFRPSLSRMVWEAWYQARGLRWFDASGYEIRGYPHCYICGRQKDFVFNMVRLTPFFDMSLDNKLVYICDDHGRVTDYDCTTGKPIGLPLPRPYWYRRIRNGLQAAVLGMAIPARFVWFFGYTIFMWYVAIWLYWFWRQYG